MSENLAKVALPQEADSTKPANTAFAEMEEELQQVHQLLEAQLITQDE